MHDPDPQTFAIIGAAFEVHRTLGAGYLEAVYCEALSLEFGLRGIVFAAEPNLVARYKDQLVGHFKPDFLCYDGVIVEVKAQPAITGIHVAQTLNYLKASGESRALLLNFGAQRLEFKRLVHTP